MHSRTWRLCFNCGNMNRQYCHLQRSARIDCVTTTCPNDMVIVFSISAETEMEL